MFTFSLRHFHQQLIKFWPDRRSRLMCHMKNVPKTTSHASRSTAIDSSVALVDRLALAVKDLERKPRNFILGFCNLVQVLPGLVPSIIHAAAVMASFPMNTDVRVHLSPPSPSNNISSQSVTSMW
ncbi:hypothetical protein Mapa_008992 [Marchantia paleacea]|nr:hypothetical protein Mapa_008992 [Marchantia paleacea]